MGGSISADDVNADGVIDFAYTQPTTVVAGLGRLIVRSSLDASILLDLSGSAPGDGFGSLLAALGHVDDDAHANLAIASTGEVELQDVQLAVIAFRRPCTKSARAWASRPDPK